MAFHLTASVAAIGAMVLLMRRRTGGTFFAAGSALAVVLAIAAFTFGASRFDMLRLMAWAIFGYGAAFVAGAAALLRTLHRPLGVLCLAAVLLAETIGFYAFRVEPFRLQVTRYTFYSPKVDNPFRIALLADLQTDQLGAYERRVLRTLVRTEPHLVLFAGDYIQESEATRRTALQAELRDMLTSLPLHPGVDRFAVRGNVDGDDWRTIFEGTTIIAGDETEAHAPGLSLRVTTLSLQDSFDPTLRVPPSDGFHIVVGHAPDFALADPNADLLLAGHTHGGQVRLPGIGPLITLSKVPRSWAAGMTDVGRGTLIVSRGTGMERGDAPRLRFLCRPELVLIEVLPA